MKTLETYLVDAEHNGVVDHQLHVTRGPDGEVRAILFPIGGAPTDEPATEFEVRGDDVNAPLPAFEIGELAPLEGPALATKDDIDELRRMIGGMARAS